MSYWHWHCDITGVSLPILNILGGNGIEFREVKLFLEKANSRNNVSTHDTAILGIFSLDMLLTQPNHLHLSISMG